MAKKKSIDYSFKLKFNKGIIPYVLLIIIILFSAYYYLMPVLIDDIPFGNVDAPYHSYSIRRTMEKGGLLGPDDYKADIIEKSLRVQKPPGFHGILAGLTIMFHEFDYGFIRILVYSFIIVSLLLFSYV